MLREKLKRRLLVRPLLLLAALLALTQSAMAWDEYYMKQYSGDGQWSLTWNNAGYLEGEIPENNSGVQFNIVAHTGSTYYYYGRGSGSNYGIGESHTDWYGDSTNEYLGKDQWALKINTNKKVYIRVYTNENKSNSDPVRFQYRVDGTGSTGGSEKTFKVELWHDTGTSDGWICNSGQVTTNSSSTVTLTNVTMTKEKDFNFNVIEGSTTYNFKADNNDTWVQFNTEVKDRIWRGSGSSFNYRGETGTYDVVVNLDAEGNISSFKIVTAGSGGGGGITGDLAKYHYYICGDWTNGWGGDDHKPGTGSKELTCPDATNRPLERTYKFANFDGNHKFKVMCMRDGEPWMDKVNENEWIMPSYAKGVDPNTDGEPHHNRYLSKDYPGNKTVTFTLTIREDGSLDTVIAEWEGQTEDDVEEASKVYLLAKHLNDNQETPDWLMTNMGEGVYELKNFAMRSKYNKSDEISSSDLQVVWYDALGKKNSKTFSNLANMPQWDSNMQPGWAYNAAFDMNSQSLSIAPASGKEYSAHGEDALPFISILGMNFRQKDSYTTRHYHKGRMGNTDLGWQEAYIVYDENGNPMLSSDGQAYYQTCWPPKNNILMVSNVNASDVTEGSNGYVEPLNTDIRNLTLKRDAELMTGANWTSSLKAIDADAYSGLNLESGKNYYHFSTTGMWMLGTFKIWTGWAGQKVSWGAGWNDHLYWGPHKNNCHDKAGSDLKVQTVEAKTTYYPNTATDTQNFDIENREYFQQVDFFIPFNNGEYDFNAARLYLVEAVGQAKIDAVIKNKVGAYAPSLVPPSGYDVTAYKITRRKFDANADEDEFVECDVNCQPGNGVIADVNDVQLTTSEQFKNQFAWSSDFSNNFVKDAQLGAGSYVYKMEVTFTNNLGETKTATVYSPRIEVIDDNYTMNVTAEQLIRLSEPIDGYNFITYAAAPKLVNLDGLQPSGVKAASLTAEQKAAIYDESGIWTNYVLLASAMPAKYTQQGGTAGNISKFDISIMDVNGNLSNTVGMRGGYKDINGSNYYLVANLNKDLTGRQYKVEFEGKVIVSNGEQQAKAESTTYYAPTFPLPYFGTPFFNIEQADDAYALTVTHEDLYRQENGSDKNVGYITANAINLGVIVPVVLPNIASDYDLNKTVLGELSLAVDGCKFKVSDPTLSEYQLVYTYQSPYDYLEQVDGDWKAKGRTWSFSGTTYNGDIKSYVTGKGLKSAALKLDPYFSAPNISTANMYKQFVLAEGASEKDNRWVARIVMTDAPHEFAGDEFAHRLMQGCELKNSEKVSHIVKVDGKYHGITDHECLNDKEKEYVIFSKQSTWCANWETLLPKSVQIHLGNTYVFSAGDEQGKSHFLGFEGQFPYIRYDRAQTIQYDAPRKAPANLSAMETLADGDSGFLFVPGFAEVGANIQTAVDVIEGQGMQLVVTGVGFMDLREDAQVFAADGRKVYEGKGQISVPAGVYVVTNGAENLKVVVR